MRVICGDVGRVICGGVVRVILGDGHGSIARWTMQVRFAITEQTRVIAKSEIR